MGHVSSLALAATQLGRLILLGLHPAIRLQQLIVLNLSAAQLVQRLSLMEHVCSLALAVTQLERLTLLRRHIRQTAIHLPQHILQSLSAAQRAQRHKLMEHVCRVGLPIQALPLKSTKVMRRQAHQQVMVTQAEAIQVITCQCANNLI